MTRNIRERRGSKVAINVPVFFDKHTPVPFKSAGQSVDSAALDDHIYMDCMCFGMGMCCLQATFQAKELSDALRLYDHLAVLAPIMVR